MAAHLAYHRFALGDEVRVKHTTWTGDSTDGRIVEITDTSKPKRTTYRVLLGDETVVNASEQHLEPMYGRLGAAVQEQTFAFSVDERVDTVLGEATVIAQAQTPLGNLYRVEMQYDGSQRDFLESEILLKRQAMTIRGNTICA